MILYVLIQPIIFASAKKKSFNNTKMKIHWETKKRLELFLTSGKLKEPEHESEVVYKVKGYNLLHTIQLFIFY